MSVFLSRRFSASLDALRATISVGDASRNKTSAINAERGAHAPSREIKAPMANARR
jgi:hypothetical protein